MLFKPRASPWVLGKTVIKFPLYSLEKCIQSRPHIADGVPAVSFCVIVRGWTHSSHAQLDSGSQQPPAPQWWDREGYSTSLSHSALVDSVGMCFTEHVSASAGDAIMKPALWLCRCGHSLGEEHAFTKKQITKSFYPRTQWMKHHTGVFSRLM